MKTLANVKVIYDSKETENEGEVVGVTMEETVVVHCDFPISATCDEEAYYHLLKKAVLNLTGDVSRIWAIDIYSNIPEICLELELNINLEEALFFFLEPSQNDVFVKYLVHQLGISSNVGPYDPIHICNDCMSHYSHEQDQEDYVHHGASEAIH